MPRRASPKPLRIWFKIGCLGFGGPAGQIALMHRILVDEKKWIDEPRFLHALNFCMLLPGPEAQQLATYIGWLLHGVRGGIVAGVLFVLPGAFVMLALKPDLCARAGRTADRRRAVRHQGRGAGDRGGGADPDRAARAEDLAAGRDRGVSLYRHFLSGAAVSADRDRRGRRSAISSRAQRPNLLGDQDPAKPSLRRIPGAGGRPRRRPSSVSSPGGRRWRSRRATLGREHVLVDIGTFFSKLAVVSFGGAYALLAYMAQEAVDTQGWMTAQEMVDGLGLAETTPGPLILVTQFVGFLAGYREAAPFTPVTAGVIAAAMTTWVTFTRLDALDFRRRALSSSNCAPTGC